MYIRKENCKNVIQTPTFLSHITTRSERKKLLKGLLPPKKQKLLQSPPPSDYPLEPARLPPPEARSATSTSPLLSPRNKITGQIHKCVFELNQVLSVNNDLIIYMNYLRR